MTQLFRMEIAFGCVWLMGQESLAAEFEKLGTSIARALGTTKVFQRRLDAKEVAYYSKNSKGGMAKIALVERAIYEPDCTHTWVVALDAKTVAVDSIRVVEMSCPHGLPTRDGSFLRQYVGKGPSSLATLDADIVTIAKATGTSQLLTTAVGRAIKKGARVSFDR